MTEEGESDTTALTSDLVAEHPDTLRCPNPDCGADVYHTDGIALPAVTRLTPRMRRIKSVPPVG
jgi:hypothetical protein